MKNEIIASWFDRTYVRRDGVLYEEWLSYCGDHQRRIEDSEIPASATHYEPTICYESETV